MGKPFVVLAVRGLPTPNGCRWCGLDARSHGISHARSTKFHTWANPTTAQRKARMRARAQTN
ncbi:hypothetical protein E3T53_11150 [Cryobacterium psychrophilum]|uniref:Uncharacterized protein n=1 Tax=Cryobacterium psychrophilum TaxID=41988 RepID=A0A4Y8KSR9_9MICO|nr:hypothetical protein E3T53_11150 [Cryobacterium psychrophilum]